MTSSTESSSRFAEEPGNDRAWFEGSQINRLFLTPRERGALRSLQMGEEPWPHRDHEMWDTLSNLWLVRIEGPARRLALTERGRAYPT